jgi:hypothetical protein
MDPKKAKAGMEVRIVKTDVTTKRYKTTPEMINMIGGVFKIYEVRKSNRCDHGVVVYMEGWNWAPEDLFPNTGKVIKGGKFHLDNLI